MNQYANRRWHFYLEGEPRQNLCKKKRMRIKHSALLLNTRTDTTNKRWKLIKKKGKLVRIGVNSGKQKGIRYMGMGNKINTRTNMASLKINRN